MRRIIATLTLVSCLILLLSGCRNDEKEMESEHGTSMPGMEHPMDAEEEAPDHGADSGPATGGDHAGMKHDMPSPPPPEEPAPPADR